MTEKQKFDLAMAAILRADPKAVKAAMETEIQANTAGREAITLIKLSEFPNWKSGAAADQKAAGLPYPTC